MQAKNFYAVFLESVARWPKALAVADAYETLTFGELAKRVDLLRMELLRLGIKPGQGLGILAANGRNFVIALMAGLGAEAVVMPLFNQMKNEERENCLKDSAMHALLGEENLLGEEQTLRNILPVRDSGFGLQWLRPEDDSPLLTHVADPAVIRFTSGTTDRAKGVILSHASILERTEAVQSVFKLTPEDRIIWVLPMAFHFIASILFYLRYGACLCICPNMLADTLYHWTEKFKGTLLYAAPLHYQLLLAKPAPKKMKSLRWAVSTSFGLSRQSGEDFLNTFQLPITQAFGSIELGLPLINFTSAKTHPEAVGHALPGYEVEILGEQLQILPPDHLGKLAVRGSGLFDGYLSPPQTRAQLLTQQWFLTGDMASKTAQGLVTIQGREKAVINVGGNKVFPEEVENILNNHPKVAASRVYAAKHALLGEVVHAEVMLCVPETAADDELRLFCARHLSLYKIPQRFFAKQSINMTHSGKVLR